MNLSSPSSARVLLIAAMLAVFLPLVSGDFVWDDHLLVVDNSLTDSLANAVAMFQTDLWGSTPVPEPEPGYYRPLMLVDLALTRAIAGLDPGAHRFHNLLWHGLAVVLLVRLLDRLKVSRMAATIGAAVFAVHPVQVEAVGFVAARNDPMAAAWMLLALLLLSKHRPSLGALVGGAAAACAAMLCKESVAFAPIVLMCTSRVRWGGWGTFMAHVAMIGGLAAAFVLRWWAGVGAPAQADAAHLKAFSGPALALYLDKLIWPMAEAPVIHLAWEPVIPWALAGCAAVLLAVLAWTGGTLARCGLIVAGLGLAPAFAAVAHVGAVVDRYMYLPMVGVAWMVASVMHQGWRQIVGVGTVFACVIVSSMQVPIWANDGTLWKASIERAPSGYAMGALARWLEDQGEAVQAAHWYREAVVHPPRPFHESCYNVTRIQLKLGDPEAAIVVGREAEQAGCEVTPELVAPVALAHALVGEWDESLSQASRLDEDPTGKALIARLASQAALGDVQPLREAIERDGPALADQVMKVLKHGQADLGPIRAQVDF